MKNFIGEASCKKILEIIHNALSKKEDIMNEITDQQVKEMWNELNQEPTT